LTIRNISFAKGMTGRYASAFSNALSTLETAYRSQEGWAKGKGFPHFTRNPDV
jgi:hypothetical protein